jgi:hypothetical protein
MSRDNLSVVAFFYPCQARKSCKAQHLGQVDGLSEGRARREQGREQRPFGNGIRKGYDSELIY